MRALQPLRAFILAVPLTVLGMAGASAAPDLVLDYDIYYGGVSVMKVEARLDWDEGANPGYAITLEGRTVGLFDTLKPLAFKATAEGVSTGMSFVPSYYATSTHKRGKQKALSVHFRPNGAPVARFTPADDAEEPAPPELLQNAIDPGSAVLTLLNSFARSSACSGKILVYDGKRRYDVAFIDLPREMLQKTSYSIYSGEAKRCRLDMTPVFGFKPGKRALLDESTVWFGKVLDNAPPLPVRIDAKIGLGPVRLHLASARWVDQQASR